ncbi:MAG: late competence development ComFB family protein [Hormoscilla sp.]
MEPLAIEEIDRQMQQLPLHVANSINKADAIAYALNRLPPLYATTEEGWTWQQERARETLQNLICQAASWGLRAAQRQRKGFATWLQQPPPSQQHQDDACDPQKGVKKLLKLLAG